MPQLAHIWENSRDGESIKPAAVSKPARRPNWTALSIKILLTVAILGAIVANIDWSQAGGRLEEANIVTLLAAVATLVGSIVLGSVRWSIVARLHGISLPAGLALRANFAALFFGQVLPSTVGADAVRSWLVVRRGLPATSVVPSVVVDRICGLLGLTILVLAGLPRLLTLSGLEDGQSIFLAVILVAAGVAGAVGLMLILGRIRLTGLAEKIQTLFVTSAKALASASGLGAIALSVAIQALAILTVILIARSIGLSLNLMDGLATVPAAILIAAVPITVNGWGIREGAMITAMGVAGVSPADALVVSVLFGVTLIIASLPGALAWISIKRSQ